MRFTCTIEGLEANWIEFSDVWTRREGEEMYGKDDTALFDKFLRLKCTACHIQQVEGPAITDPTTLTWESMGVRI